MKRKKYQCIFLLLFVLLLGLVLILIFIEWASDFFFSSIHYGVVRWQIWERKYIIFIKGRDACEGEEDWIINNLWRPLRSLLKSKHQNQIRNTRELERSLELDCRLTLEKCFRISIFLPFLSFPLIYFQLFLFNFGVWIVILFGWY